MIRFLGSVFLFFLVCQQSGAARAQGIITVIAGNGISQYIGDGSPATNYSLGYPESIFIDKSGKIFIAERSNMRIRTLKNDTLATIAGDGTTGYSGNGGPLSAAIMNNPDGVFADTAGSLYITEWYNDVVRKVDAGTGIINTICGTGVGGYGGDGGPATDAHLEAPYGACADNAGNVYIPDYGNHRIRKVDAATGVVTTIAGIGINGYYGDGGLAVNAKLSYPNSICMDTAGNIYFTEAGNHVVRKIDVTTKIISTVTGTGTQGYSGDWGPAVDAQLSQPNNVFADKKGNLFVSDFGNNVVRAIAPTGIIYTIAGSGAYGFDGNGLLALNAAFRGPAAVFADDAGYIFIADGGNSVIWKISPIILGTDNLSPPAINLFPNPGKGRFTVTTDHLFSGTRLEVYNSVGQCIYQSAMAEQRLAVDISGVAPGIYFVHYKSPGSDVVQKLIVL